MAKLFRAAKMALNMRLGGCQAWRWQSYIDF
jgi:hypothetical protein